VPKELGGDGGPGTNPEQLFAAGYAACFANAMVSSARREGSLEDVQGMTVTAHIHFGALGKGRFGLGVTLECDVPALDQAAAEDLVARAHERCPYSNATRGNIDHQFEVKGGS
jgi:lipoyl-dependent peroxiredoxin